MLELKVWATREWASQSTALLRVCFVAQKSLGPCPIFLSHLWVSSFRFRKRLVGRKFSSYPIIYLIYPLNISRDLQTNILKILAIIFTISVNHHSPDLLVRPQTRIPLLVVMYLLLTGDLFHFPCHNGMLTHDATVLEFPCSSFQWILRNNPLIRTSEKVRVRVRVSATLVSCCVCFE